MRSYSNQAPYWNTADTRPTPEVQEAPPLKGFRPGLWKHRLIRDVGAMLSQEGPYLPRTFRESVRSWLVAARYRPDGVGASLDEAGNMEVWVSDPEDWRADVACDTIPSRLVKIYHLND